jgi:hypothetical protein
VHERALSGETGRIAQHAGVRSGRRIVDDDVHCRRISMTGESGRGAAARAETYAREVGANASAPRFATQDSKAQERSRSAANDRSHIVSSFVDCAGAFLRSAHALRRS